MDIDLQVWDIYVPFGFFTKINIHKKIESHLKTKLHNIQYYTIPNNILFLVDTYFNPLLHAIRNNGIRFFSFWNSKENVLNKVIPKKIFLICCK